MSSEFGSDWTTSGNLDDEWVTFRNVRFDVMIESDNPDQPFLIADFTPDDTDVEVLEEVRIGVGSGWQESEDNASLERVDGKKLAFHNMSKAGRLLTSFLANGGREAAAAKAKAGDTSTPFDAAWWEGLHVRIVSQDSSFTTRDGEKVDFSYFEVAETDGWDGDAGAAKKGGKPAKKAASKPPAKKKAAAKKAEPEPEPEPVVEAVEAVEAADGDLLSQVREHCANTQVDTHDDWLMEVYTDIPAVADDADVSAAVEDSGADGVWAQTWA